MINWTPITTAQPNQGEWVLATYFMKDCGKWRTRIYYWDNGKDNRKITHWSYITTPDTSKPDIKCGW